MRGVSRHDTSNPIEARWSSRWHQSSENSAAHASLLRELRAMDNRIRLLEASPAFRFFERAGSLASRMYTRLRVMLMKSGLGNRLDRFRGRPSEQEQYRHWWSQYRSRLSMPALPSEGRQVPLLISVLLPVGPTPGLPWLRQSIESVCRQTYQDWELLVAPYATASDLADTGTELRSLGASHGRIRYLDCREDLPAALHAAFNLAHGQYVALLGQHDTLEPDCLASVADVVLKEEADIVYTDEDTIDSQACPLLPVFKPAWSPALLLSCLYLGNLLAFRREAAGRVGGFRDRYEGDPVYDLVLRLTDQSAEVAHLPRVLYHRRQNQESVFPSSWAPASTTSRAIEDAVSRRGLAVTVAPGERLGTWSLSPRFAQKERVSIIVPTRNSRLLARLLGSIQAASSGLDREIQVILHAQKNKEDLAVRRVAERYDAQVLEYHGPFDFSRMNNSAAARTAAPFLVFVNDDVIVRAGPWPDALCACLQRERVGIAGSRLLYPDGTLQHAGLVLSLGDVAGHVGRFQLETPFWPWLNLTRNVSAVTGACLAARLDLFTQLGGFDSRFPNNYNDLDLCLRARRAGYEVVLVCDSTLCHDEARTRRQGTSLSERLEIRTQWGPALEQVDPFYSPHLSHAREVVELGIALP